MSSVAEFVLRQCYHVLIELQEELSKEEVKIALLSALLLPLRALQSRGKKGKTVPIVPLVVGESMKWPKKYAAFVQDIQAQAPELLTVSQTLQVHMLPARNCNCKLCTCKPDDAICILDGGQAL